MMRKILDRVGFGWIFLVAVVLIYAIVGAVNYSVFEKTVLAFGRLLWSVLPILGLVFGLLFLTNLFLEPKRITRYLGEGSGLKGWAFAILGGIISAGPIYMWYPLLSDLKEKGMKNSLIATFLYNRAIKIPLMPMMIFYFGWAFTILLALYMVIFSVIDGIVVEKLVGKKWR